MIRTAQIMPAEHSSNRPLTDKNSLNHVMTLISRCLLGALRDVAKISKHDDITINPEEIMLCRGRILSSCMAALMVTRVNGYFKRSSPLLSIKDLTTHTSELLGNSPMTGQLLNLVRSEQDLVTVFLREIKELEFENISLMDIYEGLHAYHFTVRSGRVIFETDKALRNGLGAYYTPDILADICVSKVLNSYIEEHIGIQNLTSQVKSLSKDSRQEIIDTLKRIKVADLSCGVGRFLLAAVRIFKNVIGTSSAVESSLTRHFILNLYGIDIDYIALEITGCELTIQANDLGMIDAIRSNLVHGNPLIQYDRTASVQRKQELFDLGWIYNPELAADIRALPDQIDLVIGNPPWEKIRFEERSFFASIAPGIASHFKKNERSKAISLLREKYPKVYSFYSKTLLEFVKFKDVLRQDSRFSNSAHGELNSCALFLELAVHHVKGGSRVGLLVKSAIVTSQANRRLFGVLLSKKILISVSDFINTAKIFGIDGRERFCLILLGKNENVSFLVRMGLINPQSLLKSTGLSLSASLLRKINPITNMIPNVKNDKELDFLIQVTILFMSDCLQRLYKFFGQSVIDKHV